MLSAGDAGRSSIGRRAGSLAAGKLVEAEPVGDATGEVLVDVAQVGDHPLADVQALALAQLEHEGVDDVVLLDGCLADQELAGLAVVVGERLGPDPSLRPGSSAGKVGNPPLGSSRGPPSRRSTSSVRS